MCHTEKKLEIVISQVSFFYFTFLDLLLRLYFTSKQRFLQISPYNWNKDKNEQNYSPENTSQNFKVFLAY